MIIINRLPKFTLICYVLSLLIIGFVFAENYYQWGFYGQQFRIGLLVVAAIIGVAGSMVSIIKQLRNYLKIKQD